MDYAILVDKQVIPATADEWAEFFGDIDKRRVGYTIVDGHRVSTVFLGSNHAFGINDKPLWFETMIFSADESDFADLFTWRYTTYEEAEAGHNLAVRLLREKLAEGHDVHRLSGSN